MKVSYSLIKLYKLGHPVELVVSYVTAPVYKIDILVNLICFMYKILTNIFKNNLSNKNYAIFRVKQR